MNESEKDALIERYLLHQLEDEEQASFEEQLLYSASLRSEVEKAERIIAAVRIAEQIEARQIRAPKVDTAVPKKAALPSPDSDWFSRLLGEGLGRRALAFGTLAAALFAVFLWIQYTFQPRPEPKTPVLTNIPDSSGVDGTDSAITRSENPDAPGPGVSGLIADAPRLTGPTFEPNPYLEDLITDHMRSAHETITLTSPESDAVLSVNPDGRVTLAVLGSATSHLKNLSVRLYRNDQASYLADRAVFSESIKVTGGTIQASRILKLEAGLYYLVVEHQGETVHVGKVMVTGQN